MAGPSAGRPHRGGARHAARGHTCTGADLDSVSPTFQALSHREFRIYWSGMLVSNVGTWMQRIAQDWLVLVTLGGGALATGITTGLQFLPMLLIAPFGGVLADNLAERRLLVGASGFLRSEEHTSELQ